MTLILLSQLQTCMPYSFLPMEEWVNQILFQPLRFIRFAMLVKLLHRKYDAQPVINTPHNLNIGHFERGVAIFAKAFMGIPAQQAAKITRPLISGSFDVQFKDKNSGALLGTIPATVDCKVVDSTSPVALSALLSRVLLQ